MTRNGRIVTGQSWNGKWRDVEGEEIPGGWRDRVERLEGREQHLRQ